MTSFLVLQENLQLHLKSTQGPIEVYLCQEEVQEPDSPAKEQLPSTSTLSPVPDFTQPSSSTNPGILEATASPGRDPCPEGQEVGRATSLHFLFHVSICCGLTFYSVARGTVLPNMCAHSLSHWQAKLSLPQFPHL